MKKIQIIVLALFTVIILVGCSNNQDKQIQQQNTLLQQHPNLQYINTDTPGYVTDTDTTLNSNTTGSTKTIPFDAVAPANNNYTTNEFNNR